MHPDEERKAVPRAVLAAEGEGEPTHAGGPPPMEPGGAGHHRDKDEQDVLGGVPEKALPKVLARPAQESILEDHQARAGEEGGSPGSVQRGRSKDVSHRLVEHAD